MKIFLDTAETDVVRKHFKSGLIDGLTTNPTLIRKSGKKMKENIFWIIAIITITIPQVFILMNMKDLFDKPIQIEVIVPSKIRVGL